MCLGRGKAPSNIVGGFQKRASASRRAGPAPRMSDGHVDLTGRWYPNAAGRECCNLLTRWTSLR